MPHGTKTVREACLARIRRRSRTGRRWTLRASRIAAPAHRQRVSAGCPGVRSDSRNCATAAASSSGTSVSNNTRATNTTGLNSDTAADVDGDSESDTHGDIELRSASDAVIASNLVALVIAPGRIQAGQTRPSAAPAQYLELQTTSPTAVDDDPGPFVKNVYQYRRLDASNDIVLPISHADLFTVVDQAVFARMRKTLVPKMQALAAKWTRYPFAMPFNPGGVGAKSVAGTYEGSLPWAYASTAPATQWQSPTASLAAGPGTLDSAACAVQPDPTPGSNWLKCDITHTGVISVNIDVTAVGAGLSFNDVGWKADYASLLATLIAPSWSVLSTDSAGNASVRFTATTPLTSGTLTVWLHDRSRLLGRRQLPLARPAAAAD